VKWSKDVGCVSVLHEAQKLPRTSPKLSEQRAQHFGGTAGMFGQRKIRLL